MEPHENLSLKNSENEIWVSLLRFKPKYQISSIGRLKVIKFRHRPTIIKKLSISNDGYIYTLLSINNKRKVERIHRLVAEAFIPNPENKPFINHKNGIKWDNRIENLEWCTHQENINHAVENGLIIKHYGKESGSILNEKQALEIFNSDKTITKLSKEYKVCEATISMIKTGKSWGWVTGKIYIKKENRSRRFLNINGQLKTYQDINKEYGISPSLLSRRIKIYGEHDLKMLLKKQHKVTPEEIIYIFKSKESSSVLSRRFSISQSMVNIIKRGESWKEITIP